MWTAVISIALTIGAAIAITSLLARRCGLADLLARAELLSGRQIKGWLPARCILAIQALLERLTAQEHRLYLTHSVTGLPTRERLASRMSADGTGTLALLSCRDYDRLCVFDVQLAERLLLEVVTRIAGMLPEGRLLAQVDRSHLAIWIGPDAERDKAQAEIDAVAYALGDRIVDGDREILPEIVTRKASFDGRLASPQSIISQTLSAFAVPGSNDIGPQVGGTNLGIVARDRFQVEQDLRQALSRSQLRMQYQPLIDAGEGRVCGAEALVRWDHPERGTVPPSRFIPIAETAGLSLEIGLWALNQASRDARSWRAAGSSDLRVAVNVTGHQLEADDLALLIARTLDRHGLSAHALEVELTESVALADDARAALLCADLRRRGVQIAIDDFGTGYSSLSALRNLAFDKIKIDRTFVSGVDKRRDSQAICSSLFALGRGLNIKVLAEGVETFDEYLWLRRHGCRYFQGFYFSPPMDSDAFITFASDQRALARLLLSDEPIPSQRLRA